MHLGSFKRLATVSAIALTASMYSGSAFAVAVQSGSPVTVPIHATVLNTFTVTTTPLRFGTVGVTPKAANQASAVLVAGTGAITGTTGGGVATNARISVDPANGPTVSSVTIIGLASTQVKVDYTNIVNLTFGGSTFVLDRVLDGLDAPVTGIAGTPGSGGSTVTQGTGTTDGTGHLDFPIGGTIKSSATAVAYPDGLYVGSFDVTLSY